MKDHQEGGNQGGKREKKEKKKKKKKGEEEVERGGEQIEEGERIRGEEVGRKKEKKKKGEEEIERGRKEKKEPLQHVSTLESLYILNCSGLAALLQWWRSSLSSLRALAICDCPELTSLPKEIYSLQKLETLYLSGFQLTYEDQTKIAWLPDINLTMDSLADDEFREIFHEG